MVYVVPRTHTLCELRGGGHLCCADCGPAPADAFCVMKGGNYHVNFTLGEVKVKLSLTWLTMPACTCGLACGVLPACAVKAGMWEGDVPCHLRCMRAMHCAVRCAMQCAVHCAAHCAMQGKRGAITAGNKFIGGSLGYAVSFTCFCFVTRKSFTSGGPQASCRGLWREW